MLTIFPPSYNDLKNVVCNFLLSLHRHPRFIWCWWWVCSSPQWSRLVHRITEQRKSLLFSRARVSKRSCEVSGAPLQQLGLLWSECFVLSPGIWSWKVSAGWATIVPTMGDVLGIWTTTKHVNCLHTTPIFVFRFWEGFSRSFYLPAPQAPT